MRYIVITQSPFTGQRATTETKDYEALRIDPAEIVAIVDKNTQQVSYDGETWNEFENVFY